MRLAELLHRSSIETSPRDGDDAQRLAATMPAGCEMSITFLPGEDYHRLVATAAWLRKNGFVPVPHISARALTRREDLDDLLARVAGEAAVDHVLAIAGDAAKPRGPFASSLDLLETGAFARHGIRIISLAGHPEGNPNVAAPLVRSALLDKIAFCRANGLEPRVITQFAFESAPILAWLGDLAGTAGDVPVHIGVAGPANPATLLKFALRCGVGNSVRVLQKRAGSIGRLLTDSGPDDLVRELAAAATPNVAGFHFFPFGGMKKTGQWISAAIRDNHAADMTETASRRIP